MPRSSPRITASRRWSPSATSMRNGLLRRLRRGLGESGTIEEVIGSELDAVTIAATAPAHAGLINTCRDAELPVFCEKPVALGYEETVEVVKCLESSGAILQVGFLRRFVAGYEEAGRLIDAEALEYATNRKSERPYL